MTDATPDPELTELASAYLDDAVDPAERARVEADPEVLAEVERLRVARALVNTSTEPAALSTREAHLAAALDVFDRIAGGEVDAPTPTGATDLDSAAAAAISTPTPITPRRTRGSGNRPVAAWLLGSAAALLLVVGGIAVTRSASDDDRDDTADIASEAPAELDGEAADVAEEAADAFAGDDAEFEVPPGIDADDAADGDERTIAEAEADAVAPAATEAMEEEAAMDESDDAMADDAAMEDEGDDAEESGAEASDGGDDDASEQPAPGQEDGDLVELVDATDLGDFAALAAYAPAPEFPAEEDGEEPADTTAATTAPSDGGIDPFADLVEVFECVAERDFDVIAGPASFRGELVVVGVFLDDDRRGGRAVAVGSECVDVALADLPTPEDAEARLVDG